MAYTTIDDPTAHFETKLWSGTGSTQSVSYTHLTLPTKA